MKTSAIRFGGLLVMALMLAFASGCSKPRIELAVASQANVNPDHSGRPSPVIVKMYEMRNDLAFKQGDFHSLFNEPMQTLGADLIAADELIFVPGEARTVTYETMPETRFVGIVAGFRQMDRAQWRSVIPVNPEEENIVRIELNDVSMMLVGDKKWTPEESVRTHQARLQQPAPPAEQQGAPQPAAASQGASESAPPQPQNTPQSGYVLPHARRTS